MSQSKPKSNVFIDTAGVVAREGLHQAIIISTDHVGKKPTKYGIKDWQMFILHVTQFNDDGEKETAEIHQQYHRSLDPKASLTAFLTAMGIKVKRGMQIDFGDLVGKKVPILVTHSPAPHGVRANITPIIPRASRGAQ